MLEGILFLLFALGFVGWQLRDLRKEREAARRRREADAASHTAPRQDSAGHS